MSFSNTNYQPPQHGYPPQHPGYPPQHAGYPPQQPQYAPSQQHGYAPPMQQPYHPAVAVDVHQQYAQPVQQGNSLNQPLFSPSQIDMSSSSPQHQLGGNPQARMAGASTGSGLRDRWWLLLFAVHLLMLFIIEGVFGKQLTDNWGTSSSGSLAAQGQNIVGMLVVSAVIGSVISAVWFKVIRLAQGRVVLLSVIVNVLLSLGITILYLSIGVPGAAVPFIIWGVWSVIWIVWVRQRIPLAEATLAAASKSLSDNWGPILVAYGVALVQVLWHINVAFTVIAVFYVRYSKVNGWNCNATAAGPGQPGSATQCQGDGGSAWSAFAFWYTVASFYWTAQVIRNLAHFTTAGTVSSWWLVSEIERPTWGAFKRAATTSLGTIAVGSMLVAIVELLNSGARYGGCVCSCLCRIVHRALRWFNRYAFVISAMYGMTYFDAAKHVSSLMSAKFWELLVNDSLTSSVFWMGSFIGGMVAGVVGGLWAWSALDQSSAVTYLLVLLCFVIGFNVASLFMAVIDSAVATTLVVWAEDPQSMHRNRPELHDKIAQAAQQAYPTEFAMVFVPVRPTNVYINNVQNVYVMPPNAGVSQNQQPPPPHFQPNAPPAY